MKITMPVYVEGISTRKDGSLKLVFGTQELPPEQSAILFGLGNQLGYMAFSNEWIADEDINELGKNVEMQGKTPSQRLRNVLFVLWKQKKVGGDFETYYRNQIEKIINKIKEQLDE